MKTLYITINHKSIRVFVHSVLKFMEIKLSDGHLRNKKVSVTQIHGEKNQKTLIALSSHNIWIIVCDVNNNFCFVFTKQSDVSAIYFSYIGMCYIYFFVFILIRKIQACVIYKDVGLRI